MTTVDLKLRSVRLAVSAAKGVLLDVQPRGLKEPDQQLVDVYLAMMQEGVESDEFLHRWVSQSWHIFMEYQGASGVMWRSIGWLKWMMV